MYKEMRWNRERAFYKGVEEWMTEISCETQVRAGRWLISNTVKLAELYTWLDGAWVGEDGEKEGGPESDQRCSSLSYLFFS
jgi:hypothetical protein